MDDERFRWKGATESRGRYHSRDPGENARKRPKPPGIALFPGIA